MQPPLNVSDECCSEALSQHESLCMCLCVASIVIIQGDMFYSPDHASILPQQNMSHDAALSLITTTTHNGLFTKQSGEKSNFSQRLSFPLQPQIKRVCIRVVKRFITFQEHKSGIRKTGDYTARPASRE